MKKIRKCTQLKLTNPKNAGRPAIHDIGIRHTKREEINCARSLHLPIKLISADINQLEFMKLKAWLDELILLKKELRFV